MNLLSIKEECWSIARDTALVDEDRLWPSDEMDTYVNRVYQKIARETRCITDSTSSICLIEAPIVDHTTYEAGTIDYIWANDPASWLYQKDVCQYLYDLHPSILEILEVKWVTRPWKLVKVSSRKWQDNTWWEQVIGAPTEYATDLTNKKIALNFRSEEADTLRLQVKRLPLVGLVNDDDEPEFREAYHQLMMNGILALMYSKQDADIIDKAKSAEYENLFAIDIDTIKQQETVLERRLSPNNSMGAFR